MGKLNQKVSFAWIPSHTNIRGNDASDTLAKSGTKNDKTEYTPSTELHDVKSNIDKAHTLSLAIVAQ